MVLVQPPAPGWSDGVAGWLLHHALAANPKHFGVVMLSVLMSTTQCHGYIGVLRLNLWVERQWVFDV